MKYTNTGPVDNSKPLETHICVIIQLYHVSASQEDESLFPDPKNWTTSSDHAASWNYSFILLVHSA